PTTAPPTPPGAPPTTAPGGTTQPPGGQPSPVPTAPTTTLAPVPITQVVPIFDDLSATTIAPDVLDPLAPMPSVPLRQPVRKC
ncbi:MAG: hypothetical protein M3337_05945, partial [Actinomycetota bacterium]|nr:hypothetical protein [Actinomycetota bacterium]